MEITQIFIIVIFVLLAIIFVAWKIYKDGLRKTVIDLIVDVERNLKDNQTKFETVVNSILVRLPFPFNLIPASAIENFVQKTFDEVKKALDYRESEVK